MKKIILVFMVLLFTGCDVTYNLAVDNVFEENISVINTSVDRNNDYYYEMFPAINRGIPLYYNKDDLNYSADIIDNENSFGVNLNGKFESDNRNSYIVSKGVSTYNISKEGNKVMISASGFKLFDDYGNVDTLTVNLTIKKKVLKSNADNVSNDVYTWVINKDNYESKEIEISFLDSREIINSSSDSMINFSIVLILITIVSFIIYIIIKLIYKSKNSV